MVAIFYPRTAAETYVGWANRYDTLGAAIELGELVFLLALL